MSQNQKADRVLDSKMAENAIGSDNPNDLIVNNEDITRIGNLCDVPFVRKLNISFNNIHTLDGIDQLPQLRTLYAYSCNLSSANCVQSNTKLEQLFLQDNKITMITSSFTGLSKLSHLRLDNNKISVIEHLSNCVNLKILDLSRNKIGSIEALNGLHNLTEVKLAGNAIKSITGLRSLPSLKELDLSHNQIKVFDFAILVQHVPTLEVLNLNHNIINMLVNNAPSTTAKKPVKSSDKNDKNKVKELPSTQATQLTELYLSGNKIKSIAPLECCVNTLEILDLSNNVMGADGNSFANDETILLLSRCKKLETLKMANNNCCTNNAYMMLLFEVLGKKCHELSTIDGVSINHSIGQRDIGNLYSQKQDEETLDGGESEFHTWEVGEDSTVHIDAAAEEEPVISLPVRRPSRAFYVHSDSESEEEEEKGEEDSDEEASKKDIMPQAPKEELTEAQRLLQEHQLQLKPMVSEHVIHKKEAQIRQLFTKCKDMLSMVTIFNLVQSTNEGDDTNEEVQRRITDRLQENKEEDEDMSAYKKAAYNKPNKVEALINSYTNMQLEDAAAKTSAAKRKTATINEDSGGSDSGSPDKSLSLAHNQEERFEPVRITLPKQPSSAGSAKGVSAGAGPVVKFADQMTTSDSASSASSASIADNSPAAAPAVARAAYKPLMHSSLRTDTIGSSNSVSASVDNNAMSSARSAMSDVTTASKTDKIEIISGNYTAVKFSSDKSIGSQSNSTKRKPTPTKSTHANSVSGSSVADKFASEVAKLGTPLGSGLSRHGTKMKSSTKSTSKSDSRLVSSSVNNLDSGATFSMGDDATNLLTSGNFSNNINNRDNSARFDSSVEIHNVRITKKDTKQHYLDLHSGSNAAESKTASSGNNTPDSKNSPVKSPPRGSAGDSGGLGMSESLRNMLTVTEEDSEKWDFAEEKEVSDSRVYNDEKGILSEPTKIIAFSSANMGSNVNKHFSKFGSSVIDPRSIGVVSSSMESNTSNSSTVNTNGSTSSLFEQYHNMKDGSALRKSFSEPLSLVVNGGLLSDIVIPPTSSADKSGHSTPRMPPSVPSPRPSALSVSSALSSNSANVLFRMPGGGAVPQLQSTTAINYKKFKIPEQARSAIHGPPTTTSTSTTVNNLHHNNASHGLDSTSNNIGSSSLSMLSPLEHDVLRLSAMTSLGSSASNSTLSSMAYSISPRSNYATGQTPRSEYAHGDGVSKESPRAFSTGNINERK